MGTPRLVSNLPVAYVAPVRGTTERAVTNCAANAKSRAVQHLPAIATIVNEHPHNHAHLGVKPY